jgi:phospholipid-translocating ATPase
MKEKDDSNQINDEILTFSKGPANDKLLDNSHLDLIDIKKPSFCSNCFNAIFPCFKKVDTKTRRLVLFRNSENNVTYWSNKEENHKYNALLFFPIVLFNQFRQFGNFFYLILSISQFIPQFKVGFLFTYISPLGMVVFFSMAKELYDDIKRRVQDKKTNSTLITTLQMNPNDWQVKKVKKKACDLQIGDIIELDKDNRVPADIIVLKTFNESEDDNQSFIRTDQLDGETDWKLRKAPAITQTKSEKDLVYMNGYIQYEPPSKLIYNFEGVLKCQNDQGIICSEALNLENTMWASTVVASLKVIGIIIYTGKESRAQMNSSTPKYKIGILDQELNKANVYLFFIMFGLSLIITLLKGAFSFSMSLLYIFIKFIILFCAIIPIALRVNLDVSKSWLSYSISKDESISETIARNSTIPEELGRISYVFSDKTGTLTKNEMIFKKIAMETEQFGEESFTDLKSLLSEECESCDAPLLDLYNIMQSSLKENVNNELNLSNSIDSGNNSISLSEKSNNPLERSSEMGRKQKRIRRERNKIIRDTITAMVLCNNVTPTESGFQASSPDEIALVKFAQTLNMRLIHRTDKEIKIKDSADNIEEFEVLANFPFSSDTKRMGIILKNKQHGHIIYYLKGAENVMMKFVKNNYIGYIKENAENLATKGLRTLVLTQKLLSQEEFDIWNKEYSQALIDMENRKESIARAVSKLENNMDFLCVTGVEDLLQDEVATTIDNMRNAGMKVWMLTGDKVETATCISISAGLKAKNQKIFTIRYDDLSNYGEKIDDATKLKKLKELFREYNNKIETDPHLFIIDGDSLDLALKNCEEEFFHTSMQALSVVCCRCSPTQKRIIVKTIKKYTDARTAAVGDGGNDVAMIQEADVGIGIVGKEGLQASLAADYSIKEFKTLSALLLWWGRIGYKNTSMVANFVIHRGLIISFNQFIFSLLFYYNPVALYNGMLSFGYSTIFTCLPSISILLDKDVNKDNVIKFPNLYKTLLKGRELNAKNFLWWVFKSIFQSAVLMLGSILIYPDTLFLNIVTVSFTALIYLEILNVYTEINKFHWFMGFALLGTFTVYTLTMVLMPQVLNISILNLKNLALIGILAVSAWAPFFITSKIKKIFFPETIEKLNQ